MSTVDDDNEALFVCVCGATNRIIAARLSYRFVRLLECASSLANEAASFSFAPLNERKMTLRESSGVRAVFAQITHNSPKALIVFAKAEAEQKQRRHLFHRRRRRLLTFEAQKCERVLCVLCSVCALCVLPLE